MKKRLKEMEDEAAALREMQAKVEKEMGSVQGDSLILESLLGFRVSCWSFKFGMVWESEIQREGKQKIFFFFFGFGLHWVRNLIAVGFYLFGVFVDDELL